MKNKKDLKQDRSSRKKIQRVKAIIYTELAVLAMVVLCYVGVKVFKHSAGLTTDKRIDSQEQSDKFEANNQNNSHEGTSENEEVLSSKNQENSEQEETEEGLATKRQELLEQAEQLALGYDYDGAIELLKSQEADTSIQEEITLAIASYEEKKKELVPFGAYQSPGEISHIFFHSLIVDNSKAFDGDRMENGYNYWMTTVSEFNSMMQQMYENDFVLVSIHDLTKEVKNADGTIKLVEGDLMLPPNKKPFVLSQDDVNYYEYMKSDGFAKRILIDDDGYPACEMEVNGKNVVARDFDVVPLLEKFIEEHPDFSYQGARGIIALTGYEGALGYRTNDTASNTFDEDVKKATEVANALKEMGWEFASHSYGHGHMNKRDFSYVKADTDRWEKEVQSIVGETDILIFPYGEDIQFGSGDYVGEKYNYLSQKGFRYFCGVYAYPWLQVRDQYVRMSRRNLDGFTMHFYPERLKDLMDVASTIDKERPVFR